MDTTTTQRVSFKARGGAYVGYHDVYIDGKRKPHLRVVKGDHARGSHLYSLEKINTSGNVRRLRVGTRAQLRDDLERAVRGA